MKQISLLKLYLIFLKIGAILLGGGYVILPIITNELSKKEKLIPEEDLIDYFALSQSLPGVIAANISMFCGYKLRGKSGAIAAMLGVISVPILCIICLASTLSVLTENIYIKSIFWGVGIAVIALITLTIREMWQKSERDLFFYIILTISLVLLFYFRFSPVQTILTVSVIGVLIQSINKRGKLK